MTEQMTLIKTKPNSKAQAIDMPNMRESAPPREDNRLFHCGMFCHRVIDPVHKSTSCHVLLTVYVLDSMTDSTFSVS